MKGRRWFRLFGLVGLILVLYFVLPTGLAPNRTDLVRTAVSLLGIAGLALLMVLNLRLHIDDTSRKVDGLIVGIVLVVVVFAHAFFVLNLQDPGQVAGLHTRLDSLYFTTTTLTTVGYGDVHAVGQIARALVLVQMVFNGLFVASTATLLASRLRAAASQRSQERRSQGTSD